MARLIRDHKNPLVLAVAMLCIGFGIATLAPAHAAEGHHKWEHLCEENAAMVKKGAAKFNEDLNKRGAEGWELVSSNVIPRGMSYRMVTCYKRPKN